MSDNNPYWDEKTKTGWKPPDRQRMKGFTGGTAGWTYYENGEVKHPLQWQWGLLKEGFERVKDNPITKAVMTQLKNLAEVGHDFAETTGELAVQRAELQQQATRAVVGAADSYINETVREIPNTWNFHPESMAVYGELLTHKEFNRRQYNDARQSIGEFWGGKD